MAKTALNNSADELKRNLGGIAGPLGEAAMAPVRFVNEGAKQLFVNPLKGDFRAYSPSHYVDRLVDAAPQSMKDSMAASAHQSAVNRFGAPAAEEMDRTSALLNPRGNGIVATTAIPAAAAAVESGKKQRAENAEVAKKPAQKPLSPPEMMVSHTKGGPLPELTKKAGKAKGGGGETPFFTNIASLAEERGLDRVQGAIGEVYGNQQLTGRGGFVSASGTQDGYASDSLRAGPLGGDRSARGFEADGSAMSNTALSAFDRLADAQRRRGQEPADPYEGSIYSESELRKLEAAGPVGMIWAKGLRKQRAAIEKDQADADSAQYNALTARDRNAIDRERIDLDRQKLPSEIARNEADAEYNRSGRTNRNDLTENNLVSDLRARHKALIDVQMKAQAGFITPEEYEQAVGAATAGVRQSERLIAQTNPELAMRLGIIGGDGGKERKVVRTGQTKDGKKVVQYDDGSVDYAE
jgi:hypothetical protein